MDDLFLGSDFMGYACFNIIQEKSAGNQRRGLCGLAANRQSEIFAIYQGTGADHNNKCTNRSDWCNQRHLILSR